MTFCSYKRRRRTNEGGVEASPTMPTEAARAGLEISPLVAGAAFLAIGGWLNSERYLHDSV